MTVADTVCSWPGHTDSVLRVLLACHKHSRIMSRSHYADVSCDMTMIQHALCHTDDQVVLHCFHCLLVSFIFQNDTIG